MTSRVFQRSRLGSIFMAITLLVTSVSVASAQEDPDTTVVKTTSLISNSLPVLIGILAFCMIVTFGAGFYGVFPWLLQKNNARRPLDAYGVSAALVWLLWCGWALLIFGIGEKLVQPVFNSGGSFGEFLQNWLLTCLIALAGIVGFILLRIIFRGRSAVAAN